MKRVLSIFLVVICVQGLWMHFINKESIKETAKGLFEKSFSGAIEVDAINLIIKNNIIYVSDNIGYRRLKTYFSIRFHIYSANFMMWELGQLEVYDTKISNGFQL